MVELPYHVRHHLLYDCGDFHGLGLDERLEEEETNSGEKLVSPSHCAPESKTMVGDNKEESKTKGHSKPG